MGVVRPAILLLLVADGATEQKKKTEVEVAEMVKFSFGGWAGLGTGT